MDSQPQAAPPISQLREYQRALTGFSRTSTEAIPIERLMQHLTAQVSRVTQISHVKVLRYRPKDGDLIVVAGVGWKEGVVGHATLGADIRSPPGRAMQTGAPVAIEDLPNDPEHRYSGLLREHGVISVLNVPVMMDGRTWGVLEIDGVRRQAFNEWDIDFLTALANVLGCALARAEAEQKCQQAMVEHASDRVHAEVVLQELQHRVKNNLQLIVALLASKQRECTAPEAHEILASVIGRIQAIAVAHDLLSQGMESSSINFGSYLRALCANIDPEQTGVFVAVDAVESTLPLDRAVPAGLVVNELVTNSIKYAFGNLGPDSGRILVKFSITDNRSESCVSVEDNGRGMPLPPKRGHGLTIVERFAQQLSGRIEYAKVDVGSKTVLCFPVVSE